jgi:hypothetical protein
VLIDEIGTAIMALYFLFHIVYFAVPVLSFYLVLSPPHITKLFPPKKLTQDVYFLGDCSTEEISSMVHRPLSVRLFYTCPIRVTQPCQTVTMFSSVGKKFYVVV